MKIDFRSMSDKELWGVIAEAREIQDGAVAELNRWGRVRCAVCQREDVAYRNTPFYGWTTSSGYTLCYICTSKWERKYGDKLTTTPTDNPIDEIMAILD